jgi:hypothetical protein
VTTFPTLRCDVCEIPNFGVCRSGLNSIDNIPPWLAISTINFTARQLPSPRLCLAQWLCGGRYSAPVHRSLLLNQGLCERLISRRRGSRQPHRAANGRSALCSWLHVVACATCSLCRRWGHMPQKSQHHAISDVRRRAASDESHGTGFDLTLSLSIASHVRQCADSLACDAGQATVCVDVCHCIFCWCPETVCSCPSCSAGTWGDGSSCRACGELPCVAHGQC